MSPEEQPDCVRRLRAMSSEEGYEGEYSEDEWVNTAREVIAEVASLRARVADLREILDGRTVAPTDHEIEVHAARGGRWRTRYQVGDPSLARDAMDAGEARLVRDLMRPLHAYTWWATEADGTLCAWPVVIP